MWGHLCDSAAIAFRMALWERGTDWQTAVFLGSAVVFTVPLFVGALAIVHFVSGRFLIEAQELGWGLPRRPWVAFIVAILSIPALHWIIFGVFGRIEDISALGRLPHLSAEFPWTLDRLSNPQSINRLLLSWSVLSISEEILYRGAVDALMRRGLGPIWGVLCGAALFSLGHSAPSSRSLLAGFVQVWAYGVCLGGLRSWTGSLLPGMVLHAGTNFFAYVVVVRYLI